MRRAAAFVALLALGACSDDTSSGDGRTGVDLTISYGADISPDQFEISAAVDGESLGSSSRVPATPSDAIASGYLVRVILSETLDGRELSADVLALADDAVVADGSLAIEVAAGNLVEVTVVLDSQGAEVADAGVEDAPTCAVADAACLCALTNCGVRAVIECRDLSSNPIHCGACDSPCGAPERCAGGSCACRDGLTPCEGACVDMDSDKDHCGGCGAPCAPPQRCAAGGCVDVCPADTTACGGRNCVATSELESHPLYCGTCDVQCAVDQVCRAGVCRSFDVADGCTTCPCDDWCASSDTCLPTPGSGDPLLCVEM